jgi:hypothetical protein
VATINLFGVSFVSRIRYAGVVLAALFAHFIGVIVVVFAGLMLHSWDFMFHSWNVRFRLHSCDFRLHSCNFAFHHSCGRSDG